MIAKLRAADGVPGVLDELYGEPVYLYDAHPEDSLQAGRPGAVIARRDGAILRATIDGAVWIGHLKRKTQGEPALKLPATTVLGDKLAGVPELTVPLHDEARARTYRELAYAERDGVGYLQFPFYNGAMSTRQCERLAAAIRYAKSRPTRVIVLTGGRDFWSNGIHLNVIEASATPADESWANINAIDDVALEILSCDRHLTIAAMQGNAGAGGVFLALAADRVLARRGVILNPHYKGMGNLYGSEYWTYLLPKRVGAECAREITERRLPIGSPQAMALGLIDEAAGEDLQAFVVHLERTASALAAAPDFAAQLERKRAERAADEAVKPLERYRAEELERVKLNFWGFDPSYHVARYHFVFKIPKSRTPLYLARHRAQRATATGTRAGCLDAGQATGSLPPSHVLIEVHRPEFRRLRRERCRICRTTGSRSPRWCSFWARSTASTPITSWRSTGWRGTTAARARGWRAGAARSFPSDTVRWSSVWLSRLDLPRSAGSFRTGSRTLVPGFRLASSPPWGWSISPPCSARHPAALLRRWASAAGCSSHSRVPRIHWQSPSWGRSLRSRSTPSRRRGCSRSPRASSGVSPIHSRSACSSCSA